MKDGEPGDSQQLLRQSILGFILNYKSNPIKIIRVVKWVEPQSYVKKTRALSGW